MNSAQIWPMVGEAGFVVIFLYMMTGIFADILFDARPFNIEPMLWLFVWGGVVFGKPFHYVRNLFPDRRR